MARGYYKTPEEIEAEKALQAERYPEQADQTGVDPTQALRNLIKTGIAKTNTPLGRSLQEEPKQEFEMSPDIKRYGYNLFGMDEVAPSDVQVPFPVGQEPLEEAQLERAPAAIEQEEVAPPVAPPQQKQVEQTSMDMEPAQAPQQAAITPEAQPQPTDVEKMIQQATEEEDRAALWKQSAKLRDAIMGAGSGTILKTDTSLYEDLEKRAQRPMKNFLLKQELEDKKAKNDPSSNISKLMRDSLAKMDIDMSGFENVSYNQLEKLYPALTQALYTKISAEAKKEEARSRREERQIERERKSDIKEKENYFKTQSGIDRQVQQLRTSKAYIGYQQANQAKQLLDEAVNSKDPLVKVQNAAAFMNYAKSAQGDDSVVRSEDMKVLAGQLGFNSPTELLSKFSARTKGTPFSPAELNMMSKVISTIQSAKRKQLQGQLNPIITRAENNNYPLSESLDPEFIKEIQQDQTIKESYSAKQEAGIKAYMDAKGLSREEAIRKLKEAKRL